MAGSGKLGKILGVAVATGGSQSLSAAMLQRTLSRRKGTGQVGVRWRLLAAVVLAYVVAALSWGMVRRLWRRRGALAPLYVGGWTWIIGAIGFLVPRGWVTVLMFVVVAGAYLYRRLGGWLWRFTRRRRLPTRVQAYCYVGAYVAWSTWAVAAALWGPGPPRLGFWAVATVAAQSAWAWWRRPRRVPVAQLSGAVETTWARVRGMADTVVANVVEHADPKRVTFDVDLSGTDLLVENVVKAVPHIAKQFKQPTSNIIADYAPGNLEDRATIEVVEDNPCNERVLYDESWIPTAEDIARGVTPFHLYPNGRRGMARLWYPGYKGGPGAGACGTLFSGDPGSGKSAGQTALFTQQVFTGLVWPMAACPQNGQSMPAWTGANGQARWKAACGDDNLDPIMEQLEFLREAMYDRSDRLSRFRWVDRWGDEQIGLANWDPTITGWCAIGYSISEGWRLMMEPEFATIIKELLKLQRKTGIYMNIDTQYPGIQEFGNDPAMRQPISAGNQFAYRNSSKEVKAMTLPDHLPSPNAIPDKTPSGEHTKGTLVADSRAPDSSLPVYSRSVWVERELHWARRAAERIPELNEETARVLRRYLPSGCTATTVESAQPKAGREVVTVTTEQPATAEQSARKPNYEEQIRAYLAEAPDGRAHTGVIADALSIPLPRVSEACRRAERKDRMHQVRTGVWALGARPAKDVQLELDGVAA